MTEIKKRAGDLFGGHAELYAKARPTYSPELVAYISSLCEGHEAVWDCATGTGQAAELLAVHFKTVFASDLNAEQVRVATEKETKPENIVYSVQSAEQTNYTDNQFDLITVAQALHWFDYDKFWPEVKRVLKPNGLFAAWGYDWTKINFDIDFKLEKNLVEVLAPFWSPKAKILWGGYSEDKVKFPFKQIETSEFQIEMHWNLYQLFAYFRSWSSTQAAIKEWGNDDFLKHAYTEVQKHWGDAKDVKIICFPVHMLVGRAS